MLSVSSELDHLTNSWILDSTCSYHMTPNKDWFNTYSQEILVLRWVMTLIHVPDLRKNLISLGTLDCNGFSYKSTSGVMKVSKGAMIVMKGQKLAGNIYKLLGTTIVGGVATAESESDSIVLWHMRLGHIDLVSYALITSIGDPTTFQEAIHSQEKSRRRGAMVEEIQERTIGCKWVYKKKEAVSEKEVLGLVAHFDMQLEKMDVKTTFLHGDLEELVYMVQPKGLFNLDKNTWSQGNGTSILTLT
ncbi:hypothetical protein AAG906_021401 [Vitis piasezkii]